MADGTDQLLELFGSVKQKDPALSIPDLATKFAADQQAEDPFYQIGQNLNKAQFKSSNPWTALAMLAGQGFLGGVTKGISSDRTSGNLNSAYDALATQYLGGPQTSDPELIPYAKQLRLIQAAKGVADKAGLDKEQRIIDQRLVDMLQEGDLRQQVDPNYQAAVAAGQPPTRVYQNAARNLLEKRGSLLSGGAPSPVLPSSDTSALPSAAPISVTPRESPEGMAPSDITDPNLPSDAPRELKTGNWLNDKIAKDRAFKEKVATNLQDSRKNMDQNAIAKQYDMMSGPKGLSTKKEALSAAYRAYDRGGPTAGKDLIMAIARMEGSSNQALRQFTIETIMNTMSIPESSAAWVKKQLDKGSGLSPRMMDGLMQIAESRYQGAYEDVQDTRGEFGPKMKDRNYDPNVTLGNPPPSLNQIKARSKNFPVSSDGKNYFGVINGKKVLIPVIGGE